MKKPQYIIKVEDREWESDHVEVPELRFNTAQEAIEYIKGTEQSAEDERARYQSKHTE